MWIAFRCCPCEAVCIHEHQNLLPVNGASVGTAFAPFYSLNTDSSVDIRSDSASRESESRCSSSKTSALNPRPHRTTRTSTTSSLNTPPPSFPQISTSPNGDTPSPNRLRVATTLDRLRHGAYRVILDGESFSAPKPLPQSQKKHLGKEAEKH